jgi:hypothetical protein
MKLENENKTTIFMSQWKEKATSISPESISIESSYPWSVWTALEGVRGLQSSQWETLQGSGQEGGSPSPSLPKGK